MERLTSRDKKGIAYFDDDGTLIRGANGTFHQKKDMTSLRGYRPDTGEDQRA